MNDDELHFYYNREKRLEKATSSVKGWYEGTAPKPPSGFFEALIHTKLSKMLLAAIVLIFVSCIVCAFVAFRSHKTSIAHVPFSLSAFSFSEKVYVSLRAAPVAKKSNDAIDAYFLLYDGENSLVYKKEVSAIYNGDENFLRTSCADYDILYVEAVVTFRGEKTTLKTTVERK